MTITPDTKDWTWVLNRPCSECGFDAAAVAFEDIPRLTRDAGARMALVCARADATVRPDESTWSPLEYAAHVRDVCRIFRYRLGIAVHGNGEAPKIPAFDSELQFCDGVPLLSNWDQDETAVQDSYATQEPTVVAGQVRDSANMIADFIAGVHQQDRTKAVLRSDGAQFTVVTLSQYFVHDLVHHVHDVRG